jgi:Ca2+-binding EF-hand superfamily protein
MAGPVPTNNAKKKNVQSESEEGSYTSEYEEDDSEYEEDYDSELTNEDDEYRKEKATQLRQLFDLFDEDKNGTISAEELEKAMKGYGKALSRDDVLKMMKQADANNDGVIDFKEFTQLMGSTFESYYKTYHNPEVVLRQFENAFQLFDINNDGMITTKEFCLVFEQMATSTETGFVGAMLEPSEIEKLVKIADSNDIGEVSLIEFKKILKDNNGVVLKNVMRMMRPSPIDYLNSFANMPASFRKSILHRKLVDGSQSPSQYLKPMLSESGLRALDLRVDANSGQLYPRNLTHHHTYRLSLVQARGIPMPETTIDIIARKIYISLHDGADFVCNVYSIAAMWHPARADEWQFNLNHAQNKIAICTKSNNIDLKLVFEFVIVNKKQSGKTHEITCGNAVMEIMRDGIDTIERSFTKFVTGGTVLQPVQIATTDIKSERRDVAGKLAQIVKGKPKPELIIRIRRIVNPVDDRVSYLTCPLDFIASTETINVVGLYRTILAQKLLVESSQLGDGQGDIKICEIVAPALVWFPKILDDPDLWDIFMKKWNERYARIRKQNAKVIQDEFLSTVNEMYPVLHSVYLPHQQFSGAKNVRSQFLRDYSDTPVANLCKNDSIYKPFDIKDAVYGFDMFR